MTEQTTSQSTEAERLRAEVLNLTKDVQCVIDWAKANHEKDDIDSHVMVTRLVAILFPDAEDQLEIAASDLPLIEAIESVAARNTK